MKKLFIFLLVSLLFSACKSDEPKAFLIKSSDMISIRPASGVPARAPQKVKSSVVHLTALEIVKQTTEISLIYNVTGRPAGRSFTRDQRDTISSVPRLLMLATDVVTMDGSLETDFIKASDVVLVHYDLNNASVRDTIAYIPNAVLRAAETSIIEAFGSKNIEACYNLFNTAYSFTPISGPEWRALKAKNQQ